MTATLIQRIKDLTARFGKGWHDGIQIDASDIADLCLAADALEQQAAQIDALRADAERMRGALNFIAEHMCSDWSQRCQAMVNTARAALRQEQPTPLVEIGRRTTPCGECHLQPGECCDICGARDVSGQPADVSISLRSKRRGL